MVYGQYNNHDGKIEVEGVTFTQRYKNADRTLEAACFFVVVFAYCGIITSLVRFSSKIGIIIYTGNVKRTIDLRLKISLY